TRSRTVGLCDVDGVLLQRGDLVGPFTDHFVAGDRRPEFGVLLAVELLDRCPTGDVLAQRKELETRLGHQRGQHALDVVLGFRPGVLPPQRHHPPRLHPPPPPPPAPSTPPLPPSPPRPPPPPPPPPP